MILKTEKLSEKHLPMVDAFSCVVRAGAKEVSAYVKISYRPEGEVLTIEKKVTKHHQ